LMRVLPQIADLMVAEIADAVDWAETIVVTATDPTFAKAIAAARSNQIVLDLANFNGAAVRNPSVSGFL